MLYDISNVRTLKILRSKIARKMNSLFYDNLIFKTYKYILTLLKLAFSHSVNTIIETLRI